ncbi:MULTISPECIES: phosphoribosyltransferase [unclassified Tolypothrix]|uniref:phosphoribosyltransferase n=1 Tax=unclassified Tolypothrix TaxID=2649714 RepID=UPI0005F77171|nr:MULTISPECIES: phosphoribosyltransferase [unclassified Tolypothrix]MBE9083663.1 phosphoribosyltransferase [Tolypothrix sp. LEGE 11397]UYD29011.1 phosphoribosyltransferase [Tolypothrix sp. PCC 7712]UYD35075.1 phosphoribosyltransferase [Tolypothrix sp. PCC 7601]BAY88322.1 phosphoribosyltransferase [Microchaete diplosiphon NIES-3275]
MSTKFRNRLEAGQMLGKQLTAYTGCPNLLVLGLPRGGVPVAYEVAKALSAPLDICLVRKLGVPGHKELAMGAITSGSIRVLNYDVVNSLAISTETIEQVTADEFQELQRRDRAYRGDRPPVNVKNCTVIVVDDGIATGSTMRAAITILQRQQPKRMIVAVPVAPPETCEQLQRIVDEVVCLKMPEQMCAVGLWYENFLQTTDEEVRYLLAKHSSASNYSVSL